LCLGGDRNSEDGIERDPGERRRLREERHH
jgi:hypothetical protein